VNQDGITSKELLLGIEYRGGKKITRTSDSSPFQGAAEPEASLDLSNLQEGGKRWKAYNMNMVHSLQFS
jgi:hypothetical protein